MKILNVKSILLVGLSLLTFSCHKETEQRGTVGFTTTASSGDESVGEQSITISLGETVSTATTIQFTVGGTASLNGDYSLETTSPITVAAGQSEFTFKFKVIDDAIIEFSPDDYITFTITSVSNYTLKSTDNVTYTYTIKDNDSTPTTGLQADLTWNLGDGVDINEVDMDLVILKDVTLDSNGDGGIYSATQINTNVTSGFESYVLSASLANGDYYIVVYYNTGTVQVPILLGLSDAVNGYRGYTYTFAANQAGYYVYQVTTNTSGTYSRLAGSSRMAGGLKLSSAFLNSILKK